MLDGVKVIDLKVFPDERGSFTEIIRGDWNDFLGEDKLLQSNLAIIFPNIVKAWHKHEQGQIDYCIIIKGTMKICAYDETSGELNEIVVSDKKLQIVRIPGKYWHGLKTLGDETATMVYFVTKLYDYKNPDELRRKYDDPKVIPKSINGKTKDPRIGKPWDWYADINK
ncbi:MAG: dTDP-4-dehydrorhamnose 3,5-epimerase family protein [Candidatus Micrarchaeota archaeon]|nr:dTDP-4-dehydrorhamnose 3,5-epimerase family protein [Candidatus Micrarchaeota archaeon]